MLSKITICEKTLSEVRDLNSRTFNLDQLEQVLIDEYDNPDKTNFDSLLSQLTVALDVKSNAQLPEKVQKLLKKS